MNTIKISKNDKVKIIAHRGLSGIERENTCAAFVAAGNRSYFGIETDTHVTKDGKFVIIHDETTQRVTLDKHNINVEESDYSRLEDIVLPDLNSGVIRSDLKIPLLEEYISICKKYEKVCVLEIKNHFALKDLDKLINKLREMDYLENIMFISFDFENCVNVRKILPDSNVQWLTGEEITDEMVNKLCTNNIDLDIDYRRLDEDKIKMLHSKGIKVNCWTCDNKETAEKLIDFGVDFITTNILE